MTNWMYDGIDVSVFQLHSAASLLDEADGR